MLDAAVHDLLETVDIGGEGRDDDPAVLRLLEQGFKGIAHHPFALGGAGTLGISGVCQQCQNALLSQLTEPGQVDDRASHRGKVHLEVAGLDDQAGLGGDRQGTGVGDGVVHGDELHIEAAQLDMVAGVLFNELHPAQQAMLLELALDERQGEACGIHRDIHSLEQIGQTADMVLMSVGDNDSADLILVLLHKGEVGDYHIHTEHLVIGESQTAVHNEHILAALIDGHVLADLMQTAQGNDPHPGIGVGIIVVPTPAAGVLLVLAGRFLSRCLHLYGRSCLLCRSILLGGTVILLPAAGLLLLPGLFRLGNSCGADHSGNGLIQGLFAAAAGLRGGYQLLPGCCRSLLRGGLGCLIASAVIPALGPVLF